MRNVLKRKMKNTEKTVITNQAQEILSSDSGIIEPIDYFSDRYKITK